MPGREARGILLLRVACGLPTMGRNVGDVVCVLSGSAWLGVWGGGDWGFEMCLCEFTENSRKALFFES